MKRNFWKKTAAGLLALTLVTGALPANAPVQDLFSGVVLTAHAEVTASGFCGAETNEGGEESVTWSLDDSGVLTISGTGAMEDFYDVAPWYNYRSGITKAVIESGVTGIGAKAFIQCSSITSVTIPDGVTTIGTATFERCNSLTEITIPDSVTTIEGFAFNSCKNLTSVTIPDGVTSIGDYAFSICISLTSITIPDSVTTIGRAAFNECQNLTSVTIPDSVTSIGYMAFCNCAALTSIDLSGNCLEYIDDRAFYGCSSLERIEIPDSVTGIGEAAFYGCKRLSDVTLPTGLDSISMGTFKDCKSLTSVVIPSGTISIGDEAFANCTHLTSVIISESVNNIGEMAFAWCDNLKSVIVQTPTAPTLGINAFVGAHNELMFYVAADAVGNYNELWGEYEGRISSYELTEPQYKQTAKKGGTFYTRFVFVTPKTEIQGKSNAKFTATYKGADYTSDTDTYYTGVISNGVKYVPADENNVLFVVTVSSGSDISEDLTCKLDFE